MSPTIEIEPRGHLANQMPQLLAAAGIMQSCPDAEIRGFELPDWGINFPARAAAPRTTLRFGTHFHALNVRGVGAALRRGEIDSVVVDCWA